MMKNMWKPDSIQMTIFLITVVRFVFYEDNKYYQQIFLDSVYTN